MATGTGNFPPGIPLPAAPSTAGAGGEGRPLRPHMVLGFISQCPDPRPCHGKGGDTGEVGRIPATLPDTLLSSWGMMSRAPRSPALVAEGKLRHGRLLSPLLTRLPASPAPGQVWGEPVAIPSPPAGRAACRRRAEPRRAHGTRLRAPVPQFPHTHPTVRGGGQSAGSEPLLPGPRSRACPRPAGRLGGASGCRWVPGAPPTWSGGPRGGASACGRGGGRGLRRKWGGVAPRGRRRGGGREPWRRRRPGPVPARSAMRRP